jgi:hypothetical protein
MNKIVTSICTLREYFPVELIKLIISKILAVVNIKAYYQEKYVYDGNEDSISCKSDIVMSRIINSNNNKTMIAWKNMNL